MYVCMYMYMYMYVYIYIYIVNIGSSGMWCLRIVAFERNRLSTRNN